MRRSEHRELVLSRDLEPNARGPHGRGPLRPADSPASQVPIPTDRRQRLKARRDPLSPRPGMALQSSALNKLRRSNSSLRSPMPAVSHPHTTQNVNFATFPTRIRAQPVARALGKRLCGASAAPPGLHRRRASSSSDRELRQRPAQAGCSEKEKPQVRFSRAQEGSRATGCAPRIRSNVSDFRFSNKLEGEERE